MDELERINLEHAEKVRSVQVPPGAKVEGMLISEIDEIMSAAEAPARAANLKVKRDAVRELERRARRRKPLRVVSLVLVLGGSIVGLVGTAIPAP